MKFTFKSLHDHPILDVATHPSLGGNINGPSLLRVPEWLTDSLGKYYLYFAHHEGKTIRLAYADNLTGDWTVFDPGTLALEDSLFVTQPPRPADTHPDVQAAIAAHIDGDYPHIASPDMHIDHDRKKIVMYYHGRNADGTQQTRRAESDDGITFTALPPLLGDSYFRVFEWRGYHYAIAWGSKLYRSTDGGFSFEAGPRLTAENYRHGAILKVNDTQGVDVIWSRAGDCPESLLVSSIVMTDSGTDLPWQQWRLGDSTVLRKPVRPWEGADEPLIASSYGGAMHPVNEVRDPCIYQENADTYLLYSVRGEQGIAIAALSKS